MRSVWLVYNRLSEVVCESREIAEEWAAAVRQSDRGTYAGKTYVEEKRVYDRMPDAKATPRLIQRPTRA